MKCAVCGKKVTGNYVVCYEHRETKYKGECPIHGKTTFIGRQCQKCKDLKVPLYVVKNGKDRFGKKITKTHFLYPYLDRLTNLERKYQARYQRRISNCSGIYGIFAGSTCLYVGQSTNITNRIEQHKDDFKIAQKQMQGIRILKKRICLKKIKKKVEFKYYEMAKAYKLSDLSYKTLFVIPRIENDYEFNELLTYGEQAMMIAYKPKYNHIAARPSEKRVAASRKPRTKSVRIKI